MLLALILATCTSESGPVFTEKPARYFTLLKDSRLWAPEFVIFCSGLAYGFCTSVLPVFFLEAHIPVAYFFTSFGIALLLNRLVGLRFLQRLPPPWIVALGLVALLASMSALLITFDVRGAVISGILFGLGYLLHPAAVAWSIRIYPDETVRPIALINIALGCGTVVSAQIGAALLHLGASKLIILLCVPLILVLLSTLKLCWCSAVEARRRQAAF
jgi:predicted MFS family arabinose efflux permease